MRRPTGRELLIGALVLGAAALIGLMVRAAATSEETAREEVAQLEARTAEAQWLERRAGCRRANARTRAANGTTAALRTFLEGAARAREAAAQRDGFRADIDAARLYRGLAARVRLAAFTDCRAAYRPPPGVPEERDARGPFRFPTGPERS